MKTTTEMQIVPIAKLVPYVNNARTHSPEQITKLRSSLREFGFINPVIIDREFNVIAGHGRILAAKEEGITEVPCVFADHLTEAQKKAYIIADNRMAMDAGWDEELLRVEIESLQGMDFDPLLTGFDEKELAALFDDGMEAKEDDFDVDAELQKPAFSRLGDVWTLGRHRLGANSVTVFRKVILPLSLPGVLSGITMVFVPSVSTFAISRMLGGGTELLLGDLIERQFLGGAYNPQLGAAISLVMMIIVVICMLVMNRFGEGEEQAVML